MINIIKRQFNEQKNSVLIYLISLIGYSLLMISMFPQMKKMDIEALIDSYPEEIAKFFGESGMASYGTIEGFLAMEFLSFFFILILMFYIGSAAGSVIAGQIEKKTIDFNLSQPISRTKIVLSNTIIIMFFSGALVTLISLSIWLLCQSYNIDISAKGLTAFTILATIFVWAFYGIAILLSSILRSKIGVTLLTVGFSLASYVFLSLSRVSDKLKDYDRFSIFYLYNPEEVLKTGNINWTHIAILASVFIIGLTGSIIIFNKKDV